MASTQSPTRIFSESPKRAALIEATEFDFNHRQVGLAVAADHLTGRLGAVIKPDLDAIRPEDDVVVGQDVTLRIDDHARPVAAPRRFARPEFELLNRIARESSVHFAGVAAASVA